MLAPCVQCHLVLCHLRRAVSGVIMYEGTTATERVPELLEEGWRPVPLVVAAAHRQRQLVSSGYNHAGRPDLHFHLVDLTRFQWLDPVMGVVRAVESAQLRIQGPMRRSQPALADRRVRIVRSVEYDLLPVRREHPNNEEEVGICCR